LVDAGEGASGSLVLSDEFHKPSKDGVLAYFTAHSGDLSIELSRVDGAGGKVLVPKTLITDDIGYMAVIEDSEGNRISLHSRKQ
jgi:predicted enzyme related to lactoylglutathione lyase